MAIAKRLQAAWADPPAIYRSAPFWSWNARLDPGRLCRAIASMHRAGMGGFFMHSRYGLKTPYLSEEWFRCVRACVEKARELDMKAYLYDEDRWPSGAAGGAVTRKRKAFRLHMLVAHDPAQPEQEARKRVGLFALRLDAAGRLLACRAVKEGEPPGDGEVLRAFDVVLAATSGWYNDGTYPDSLNPKAVAEFIRLTHEAYAARCRKDFGTLIPAIFTDEPNYGNVGGLYRQGKAGAHWTPALLREFRKRRGYDLRKHLPAVLYRPAGEEFWAVRADYWRTITELFVEAFSRQIGRWCGRHRIASTGHMLSEQTLASQIAVVGACMPHYEHMQWPGIDILCDQADELATAKQCASVADQLGKQRVLSELYGCTGWDWPLAGQKFVGDWHLAAGVNFRCPHLTHYSLEGGAKRDYPASIFDHSPWWAHYKVVEDYFARLSLMLTQGAPVRDVLVLHPVESAWGVFDPADHAAAPMGELQDGLQRIIYALSGAHYDWDFGDESLLARHAAAGRAALKVGRMTYRLVVVPPAITLRATTVALLERFLARGGKVLFAGRAPDRVDNHPSEKALALVASAARSDAGDGFIPAVERLLARRVSITSDGREADFVWAMLRQVRGGRLLFIQSHDRAGARRVRVEAEGSAPVVLWDARTGERRALTARSKGGRVAVDLDLPAAGSALVSLGLEVPDAKAARKAPPVTDSRALAGPFDVELAEPNTMPLDYCCWRIGEGPWSEPVPTLRADALIRRHFGLAERANRGHQPWYLYAKGVVDTAPRGRAALRFTFQATDVPAALALAVERPQDFTITVNGRRAGPPAGWWVDEDIRTIDIAALARPGENEVVLAFDFRADMEMEDLYLVGAFGVRRLDARRGGPGGYTLAAPPRRLALGSWVGQGLDFYGGAVRYRLRVEKPARGRVRLRLPGLRCTAAVIHAGSKMFVLPWPPMEADVTEALAAGQNEVTVEVIGGRKNILGPLHTPWVRWTGPQQFDPDSADWRFEYYLTDHGLMEPPVVETLGR